MNNDTDAAIRRREAGERARALADAMTDEEDARLTAAALADPDNPPLTEEEMSRMVHAYLVKSRGGRPRQAVTKRVCTIRLDADLVERLKADGSGWQTRVNAMLRKALGL